MTHGFKKHIVLGTVFSLTLLVGSFQAAPDFKGMLSAVTHSPVLNNPVFNNSIVQGPVGHFAAAAALAATTESLVGLVTKHKTGIKGCPVAGFENVASNGRNSLGLRAGYFSVGVHVPAEISNGVDVDNKPQMVPAPLLEKFKGLRFYANGFDKPANYVTTFAALYAARAVLDRLSK